MANIKKVVLLAILLSPLLFSQVSAGTQTVGAVTLSQNPINLEAGSTKLVTCNATVSDTDGWENVTTVNATFWDALASLEGNADDANNHYTNSSCSLGANISATERSVTCGFLLQYYANPSTWTCKIRSYNSTANEASNETNGTVNSLIALDVSESTIDFGSLSLGSTSAETTATVQNMGNTLIDIQLSGTDLNCNVGSLAVSTVHYSASSGVAYSSMTALTSTPTTLDLNVPKSTGTASTNLTFWKVQLPLTGVGGLCSNTITFTAVAS